MKVTKQTRLLAMIISIMMIVATIPMGMITVSAEPTATVDPQGQAINSAEEFAAMSADGTYYLAADITLTATYAEAFTGTFDGNGKTITTSVPVFDRIEYASIGNFTVNLSNGATAITLPDGVGELVASENDNRNGYACASVACVAIASTIENVINNAAIENTLTSGTVCAAAGIVGFVVDRTAATTVTIKNCTNNGAVKSHKTNDGWGLSAGIVSGESCKNKNLDIVIEGCYNNGTVTGGKCAGVLAYVQHLNSVTIIDCHNSGDVSSSAGNPIGGIFAQTAGTVVNGFKILYSTNSGNVTETAQKSSCAGIHGKSGCVYQIIGCENSGTITGYEVGGIVGYTSGAALISNCHNSGAIRHNGAKIYQGGIGARVDGSTTIEYCSNSGEISLVDGCNAEYAGGIAGWMRGTAIRYCYNTGNIATTGYKYVGGISGYTTSAVYGCYNTGKIDGKPNGSDTLYIGQISAIANAGSKVENNYYLGGVNDLPAYSSDKADFTYDEAKTASFTAEELANGTLAFNMNTAIGNTLYYQNVNANGAARDASPVFDSTHGYVFNYNGTLYSLSFFTIDGASIRLDAVNHGIRFSTAVNKADYDALTAAGVALDFGTIITPDEYLKAAGNDFTALADGNYIDVNSTAMGTSAFREVEGEDNETYYFFCGSLTGIKSTNYDWDYSAIGYVTIGNDTVYSANYTTRNAAYVANAAYTDPNGGYTADELAIIQGYLQ